MITPISQLLTDFSHPDLVHVTNEWCQNPSNKYSSSKWKKLAIDLHRSGLKVIYKQTVKGNSKYLSVLGKENMMIVRVSDHVPSAPGPRFNVAKRHQKFGSVGLIVGPNGVSATEAYSLIIESLK